MQKLLCKKESKIEDTSVTKTVKTALVALTLLASASSAFAATSPAQHRPVKDPWVQSIHLDDASVPAAQYFQEMQRDGGE